MTTDFASFTKLSPAEQRAYKAVISFLTFLDSIQTTNLPNLSLWVTAPEVTLCLTVHAFQEAVHAQAYQYMLETLFDADECDRLYDLWREEPLLHERNQYIAQCYQDFLDNPTESNFQQALIANYLLEGLYFLNGFYFFYILAARNRMLRSAEMIRYIHRDEMTHLGLFQNMLRELYSREELAKVAYDMVDAAVEQEIRWSLHIFQDVAGITPDTIRDFTRYLGDRRLNGLGLESRYGVESSPYRAYDKYSNISESTVLSNFFESTVTEYQMSNTVKGWEDF